MEGLLFVVIVILLSGKSFKPPKRPLTEQVLSSDPIIIFLGFGSCNIFELVLETVHCVGAYS